MTDWVVCAYFTPDYEPLALALRRNLDRIGAPHDLLAVPKRSGGWEVNTRAKPVEIGRAMERHPYKTIIFVDVDCTVTGSLQSLTSLTDIVGDVGVYVRTRIRSNGKPMFSPRSGTVVLRPTEGARKFVAAWAKASEDGHRYSVDQDSLVVAIGRVPSLALTLLGNEACAVAADGCEDSIILHDRSAAPKRSVSKFRRSAEAFRHHALRLNPVCGK